MSIDWATVAATAASSGVVSAGVSWWVAKADRGFQREKWETERADVKRQREMERDAPHLQALYDVLTDSSPAIYDSKEELVGWMTLVAVEINPMMLAEGDPVLKAWWALVEACGAYGFRQTTDPQEVNGLQLNVMGTRGEAIRQVAKAIHDLKS